MASPKKRVDTAGLFKNIIGVEEPESQASDNGVRTEQGSNGDGSEPAIIEKREPAKTGRKTDKEKKQQVSVYLTEEQIVMLDDQTGIKKKDRDKSALARIGIDIVLSLSNEEYDSIKAAAEMQGKSFADVFIEAARKGMPL